MSKSFLLSYGQSRGDAQEGEDAEPAARARRAAGRERVVRPGAVVPEHLPAPVLVLRGAPKPILGALGFYMCVPCGVWGACMLYSMAIGLLVFYRSVF